jgi:hypothetical protein
MPGQTGVNTATAVAPSDTDRVALLEPDAVLAALETGSLGLSETQARERMARSGPNRIEETRGPTWAQRLLGQFVHHTRLGYGHVLP